MNFLDHLNSYIDTSIFYNKLDKMDNNDYKNLINLLNIYWTKIIYNIKDEHYSLKKVNKVYICDKNTFEMTMKHFIENDYILGILVSRLIINYI